MTEYLDHNTRMKRLVACARRAIHEPILKVILNQSFLTEAQLETLLIDLVVEDSIGSHVAYEDKASLRISRQHGSKGVSRGAFNRTLSQARRNVMRAIYTMILLAYLGLFDMDVFRPFEELSNKIAEYRRIRETLATRSELSAEEIESYRVVERAIMDLLQQLNLPLSLKSSIAKRRKVGKN